MKKNSNLLVAHHLLGAPLVIEKKLVSKKLFLWIFFQNMIRNMTGKFEIFFQNFITFHEQSPRHQQGLIGLIC